MSAVGVLGYVADGGTHHGRNASAILTHTLDTAAWKTIPSWYPVSRNDQVINPDQERFYAKRMNAKVTETGSSHVFLVSHPTDVTALIEAAASVTASSRSSRGAL
jgi:hypothetical protein